MAQAFVQSAFTSTVATASPSVAYTSNVTKGNLLVALAEVLGATATCTSMIITDTMGNVWTPAFGSLQSPAGGTINKILMGWFCIANASGANTVTNNTNAASFSNSLLEVAEFSGYNFGVLDNALASAKAAALTASALAFSTNSNNEVIFVFAFTNETGITLAATPALGYSAGATNATVTAATFYAIVPTAGSIPFGATWVGGSGGNTNVSIGFSIANSTATFAITGNCGLAGAKISFSGTSAGSTIADGSGNFTLNLPNGTYTIAPSAPSFIFSPASTSVTVSGAPVSGVNFTAVTTSIGIWVPQGVVIAAVSSDGPGQPNVLYEAGAKILSGTVFKMWFSTTNGTCYAESADGVTWTRYSGNPIVPAAAHDFAKLFKNGSTYYLYTGPVAGPVAAYTSTDGVTFTLQNASAIAFSQTWESSGFIGQLGIVTIDGTGKWWGYYTAYDTALSSYFMGQATSTDGIHWTKNPANPIITTEQPSNIDWHTINGIFYGWSQIVQPGIPAFGSLSIPSDLSRFVGSAPGGPFTVLSNATYYRQTANEGSGSTIGQVADPSLVAALGNIYMYYTAASDGTGDTTYVVKCAIAQGYTFPQLVKTIEGVFDTPLISNAGLAISLGPALASDNFARANGSLGANWTQLSTSSSFQVAAIVADNVQGTVVGDNSDMWYNAIAWPADHWAQVTVVACAAVSFVGVSLRMNMAGVLSAYRLYWNGTAGTSGTWVIQRIVANSFMNLAQGTVTLQDGDVLTGCADGSTISFYQNGNLLGAVNDTMLTSGAVGFAIAPVGALGNAIIGTWSGGTFQASPALSFSISGSTGQSGTTVSYSGTASGSVVSGAGGTYTISGLAAGTYTITPTQMGFTFSPTSSAEIITSANLTGVNFTASASTTKRGTRSK